MQAADVGRGAGAGPVLRVRHLEAQHLVRHPRSDQQIRSHQGEKEKYPNISEFIGPDPYTGPNTVKVLMNHLNYKA